MSNIRITGNIGKAPELRYTPQGKAVTTFSLALYTGGTKEAGYKESVWVRVSAWEALAEQVNASFEKGAKVTVTGTPQPPRTYVNGAGETVSAGLEITAYEVTSGNSFDQSVQDDMPF